MRFCPAGHSLQPSEFYKPVFVVSMAWLFTLVEERQDKIALALAVGFFAISATLLVLEPDVGQTLLLSLVWAALFGLSGRPLKWMAALAAAGSAVATSTSTATSSTLSTVNHQLARMLRSSRDTLMKWPAD